MFPQIQIRQVYGQIGIDADLGEYRIRQPKADMSIQTQPTKLHISSRSPELEIDQSKAFEAYNGGKLGSFRDRVSAQIDQLWLEQIARIVEKGNRMAAIHMPGNAFAEQAREIFMNNETYIDYLGPASYDNVDISFQVYPLDVQVEHGSVELNVEIHRPEIEYYRGKLEIYMRQLPSLEITPPTINIIA